MTLTRTSFVAPSGDSNEDAEWRQRRGPLLDHFLTAAILRLRSGDLRLLPWRGRVSINMADVVFENINASTVSIDLAHPHSDAPESWNGCREFVFDFSGLLDDWCSVHADTLGPLGSAFSSHAKSFMAISDEELRAAAILFAIRRDAVGLVSGEVRSREVSRGSCS